MPRPIRTEHHARHGPRQRQRSGRRIALAGCAASAEPGILAFGAYLPRGRIQRAAVVAANAWFAPGLKSLAKGERAVANWDEDAITMAAEAVRDVLDGFFDAARGVPCQIDGGLKCFGHPIGASGLRMVNEMYPQLTDRAGPRQLRAPAWGVTHNLGGFPSQNVAAVAVIGAYGA